MNGKVPMDYHLLDRIDLNFSVWVVDGVQGTLHQIRAHLVAQGFSAADAWEYMRSLPKLFRR